VAILALHLYISSILCFYIVVTPVFDCIANRDPINLRLYSLDARKIVLPLVTTYQGPYSTGLTNHTSRLAAPWRVQWLTGIVQHTIANKIVTLKEILEIDAATRYQVVGAVSTLLYLGLCGFYPIVLLVLLVIYWSYHVYIERRERTLRERLPTSNPICFGFQPRADTYSRGAFLAWCTRGEPVPELSEWYHRTADPILLWIQNFLFLLTMTSLIMRSTTSGTLATRLGRRLAEGPAQGFFCSNEEEDDDTPSPTSIPAPVPTHNENMPTPKPTYSYSPSQKPSYSSKPTPSPVAADDDTSYLCDNSDRAWLVAGFVFLCLFLLVWLYRLYRARLNLWQGIKDPVADDEKLLFKARINFYKANYLMGMASSVNIAASARPALVDRVFFAMSHPGDFWGGMARLAADIITGRNGAVIGSIEFMASKKNIDVLNDGLLALRMAESKDETLFQKNEHKMACSLMDPGDGGNLAIRMLNTKHKMTVKRVRRAPAKTMMPRGLSNVATVAIASAGTYAGFNVAKSIYSVVKKWKEFKDSMPENLFSGDTYKSASNSETNEIIKCYAGYFIFGNTECIDKLNDKYIEGNTFSNTNNNGKPYSSNYADWEIYGILALFLLSLTYPLWGEGAKKALTKLYEAWIRFIKAVGIFQKANDYYSKFRELKQDLFFWLR
jgi:hypothetical protein